MLKIDKYAAAVRDHQQKFIKRNHENHLKTIKLARKLLSRGVLDELHLSWFMDARKYEIIVPFSDAYSLEFSVSKYTVNTAEFPTKYYSPEIVDGLVITIKKLNDKYSLGHTYVLNDIVDISKTQNSVNFRNWVFNNTNHTLIGCTELMSGSIPPPYKE